MSRSAVAKEVHEILGRARPEIRDHDVRIDLRQRVQPRGVTPINGARQPQVADAGETPAFGRGVHAEERMLPGRRRVQIDQGDVAAQPGHRDGEVRRHDALAEAGQRGADRDEPRRAPPGQRAFAPAAAASGRWKASGRHASHLAALR